MLSSVGVAAAQSPLSAASLGRRIADTALRQHSKNPPAVLLNGLDAEWYNTADGRYDRYIQSAANAEVSTGKASPEFASQILLLHRITRSPAAYRLASRLDRQLLAQKHLTAREAYEADPFLAEYASVFRRRQDFAAIAAQMRQTQRKPNLRNLGFRLMTLASALPCFPRDSAARVAPTASFQRLAAFAALRQDHASGLWRDNLQTSKAGAGPLDPIGSAMVTFSLARGVRLGLLPRQYAAVAQRAWKGIVRRAPLRLAAANELAAGSLLLAASEMQLYPAAFDPRRNLRSLFGCDEVRVGNFGGGIRRHDHIDARAAEVCRSRSRVQDAG